MKFFLSSLVLSSYLVYHQASALIDCSIVARAAEDFEPDRVAACNYFLGVEHESYLEWFESIEAKYPNNVFIQGSDPERPEDGAAIHWKVDEEYVYVGVAARATGWIAFGISEAGGMTGTDMVIFNSASPSELIDAYTGDERFPQTDDCASDWETISTNIDLEGGFIMFETKRLLNTNDPQDKPILDDTSTFFAPHRVIAAWGDTEVMSYHGLNRARGSIRFFGTGDEASTFIAEMEENSEGTATLLANNFTIPAQDTTYEPFCFSRQDLIDQGVLDTGNKLHIIGWEPIIQPGNEAYVHHYVVTASTQPSCNITEEERNTDFLEMVYVWAPGEKGVAFPDFLGSPLFGDDGFQAFEVEIHYDNPTLVEGVIDNSGVRLFWTSETREQEIGIMNVGDPFIGAFGEPVGSGISKHVFDCPSSCSSLIDEEVTVLREYLHMHEVGLRMTNELIRDGEVIHSGNVEHWEFKQNGNAAVQQDSFVLKPGDAFRTTCYFEDPDGTHTWGLASSEEMCMAFMYYYPRKQLNLGEFTTSWYCGYNLPIPPCEGTYERTTLDSKEELGREYATPNTQCDVPAPPTFEGSAADDGESGSPALANAFGVAGAGIVGAIGALLV